MTTLILDIEGNGLLDTVGKIWTIHAKHLNQDVYLQYSVDESLPPISMFKDITRSVTTVIGHNLYGYDLAAIEKVLGIPYGYNKWNGRKVEIVDTLVMSQYWHPDVEGGHSLDAWGERLGFPKMNYRQNLIDLGVLEETAPKGAEFTFYHPLMETYCKRDVELTEKVYLYLKEKLCA